MAVLKIKNQLLWPNYQHFQSTIRKKLVQHVKIHQEANLRNIDKTLADLYPFEICKHEKLAFFSNYFVPS